MTLCFSVPFPVRRHRRIRHRHNNSCLSHQNRVFWTLHIWDKESIGQGKWSQWPFHDLDTRSWLWHWLTKICLSAFYSPSHAYCLTRLLRNSVGNHFLLVIFFPKFCMCFFKVKHSIGISQEWLVPLMWNNVEGWILGELYDLELWPHSWPWPWIFEGQIFKSLYLWPMQLDYHMIHHKLDMYIWVVLYQCFLMIESFSLFFMHSNVSVLWIKIDGLYECWQ